MVNRRRTSVFGINCRPNLAAVIALYSKVSAVVYEYVLCGKYSKVSLHFNNSLHKLLSSECVILSFLGFIMYTTETFYFF
jgi:hypothetical protein